MIRQSARSASKVRFAEMSVTSQCSSNRMLEPVLKPFPRNLAWARRALTFAAAIVFAGAIGAGAQAPTLVAGWTQQTPAAVPPARYGDGLAYDAGHGQLVMFGGSGNGGNLGDTWLWNGTNWTPANPQNSPGARWNQTMVYDAAQGEVVMFGGATSAQGSSRMNDTWLWNGTNWTQAIPQNNPPVRSSAAMVYDPATGQVVLFGGLDVNNAALGDTWVWYQNNWYPESSGPSPRDGAMMAYDAELGEVVLFGGNDEGTEENDTWAWNGSSWTQLTPSNSPPARDSGAMDYDPLLGQVVLYGGAVFSLTTFTDSYLSDTWVLTGNSPTTLGWTPQTSSTSPAARSNGPMVYDAAESQLVLFGGYGNSGTLGDMWTWGTTQGFGNINVCPSGQFSPTPCSNTLTLVYNVPTSTTFAATPTVVTQGATGLDFSLGSGSTCTGTVAASSTCTVVVTFTPLAPGVRTGAVELFSSTNSTTPLTTTPIYGIGGAPLAAFSPLTTFAQNTGSQTLSSPEGVAVDAAGDIFIANTGGNDVVKVPASGTASVLANGAGGNDALVNVPQSVAVDGAGDVFIGQYAGTVVEIPAGCTAPLSNCQKNLGSALQAATAVALDAAGDLFIGDQNAREVVEIPANGGSQITLYNPGGSFNPAGLAVDLAGDVYIADSGDQEVLEIPAGANVPTVIGSGWSSPQGVALDAAGDLYVADFGLQEVVEIPAGCAVASCQIITASANEPSLGSSFRPFSVAVDSTGDVYTTNLGNNLVDVVSQQNTSTPAFPTTGTGNAAGNQSFLFQNIGNQTLIPEAPYITNSSFPEEAGSGTPVDCSNGSPLAPAAACNISVNFAPQAVGTLTGEAIFYDNALNNPNSSQFLQFTGTGTAYGPESILTVTGPGSGSGTVTDDITAINCSLNAGSTTGTCTGTYSTDTLVQLMARAAAGSTFVSWGGACASWGGNPNCAVSMSQAQNVIANFEQGVFGSANVGNPSSFQVTYTASSNVASASIQVVTEGASSLDFTLSSTTCTSSIAANSSCTVTITFTPQAPGLRLGAVEISGNNGHGVIGLLATIPIYGIGQAAEAAFGPTIGGTYPAVVYSSQVTPLSNLSGYGMTTDEAGNLYEASGSNVIIQAPPYATGTQTTLTGFTGAQGVAIDGAGNLYISEPGEENSLGGFGEVLKLTPGCISSIESGGSPTSCGVAVYEVAGPHPGPYEVAVDGQGDVFVADNPLGVFEIPANGSGQVTLYNPTPSCATSPCSAPQGVAVDAAGDVFIADSGLGQVVELLAGCSGVGCPSTKVGSGWTSPYDVRVDAAGDVIVADVALAIGSQVDAGGVVEVPAGCATASCQNLLWTSGGAPDPGEITLDQVGDIFLSQDGNTTINGVSASVFEIAQSTPPTLSFQPTVDGGQSADSPRPVTILNTGNQALTGTVGAVQTSNFAEAGNSTCGTLSLNPGASCIEEFDFTPQAPAAGPVTDSALAKDNSLNGGPATQTINLSGTAQAPPPSYALTVTGMGTGSGAVTDQAEALNCTITNGSAGGTCSYSYTSGSVVTLTETPNAATFAGWGGACASYGTSQQCQVTMSSAMNVTANFTANTTYALTVTDAGTGSGSVTSNSFASPAISCAISNRSVTGTCTENDGSGAQITLAATAAGTSIFAGWGGACASFGASASCQVTMSQARSVDATFVALAAVQPSTLVPITAGVVWGQAGSFTTANGNNGGISASGLYQPENLAIDGNGNLYVADLQNSRVLYYPAGSTTATLVYGQNNNFTTGSAPAVSAGSLNNPYGIALDSSGNLYIADWNNNRVLFYLKGSTTATAVYGQNGSFTTNSANIDGVVDANGLNGPQSVALDSSGNLYVADTNNSRVLFYPAGIPAGSPASTTATQVWGQGGNLTSGRANYDGVAADSLSQPYAIALDSSGDLYVADQGNNRVLFYPAGSTTATQVYGQNGNLTSSAPNNGSTGAGSLSSPQGVALDSGGNLYVADYSNNRVLFYPFGSTTATRVYGQGGSFSSTNSNTNANALSTPAAVVLDNSGNVYIADKSNNRVLEYGPFGNVSVCSGGSCSGSSYTLAYYAPAPTAVSQILAFTQGVQHLDFSAVNGGSCITNFVAGQSCTVSVTFTPTAPGLRMGAVELLGDTGDLIATQLTYGVGQAPEVGFTPSTQTTVGTGLGLPYQTVADAAGNLYIADSHLNEVFKIAPGGAQTTIPATGLNGPSSVAVDGAGNVFITDSYNGRVVEVPYLSSGSYGAQVTVPTTGLSTGLNGLALDGSGDIFVGDSPHNRVVEITSNGVQTTVGSGLNYPSGVAVDGSGDVFIADADNHRVVKVTPGGVQTTVPATGLSIDYGVAVDAAGDVFIADSGNNQVVEVMPGGSQTTVLNGLDDPLGVSVDALGNIYIDNTYFGNNSGQVLELQRSQPELWNFESVNVGSRSNDTGYSIQNVGNQTLTGTVGSASNANFAVDLINSTCTSVSGISLTPGATCVVGIYAQPTVGGLVTGTVPLSDNSLNGNPATQAISVEAMGLGSGTSYALTVTDIGSGSGTVSSGDGNIGCVDTNGTVTGNPSCSASYSSGTVTLTATASAGSKFLGWGGACASSATSPSCTVTMNASVSVTASFGLVNLGSAYICAAGFTPPVGSTCSAAQTLTFNIPATTTIGAIQVVTQGVGGLDFSQGSGSTCTGQIAGGNSCNVSVNFTPLAPGLRTGAVELYDNNGNLLEAAPVFGVGQAPAVAFSPSPQVQVPATGLDVTTGIAVDASGNVYVSDQANNRVLKLTSGELQTVVATSGLNQPAGLAVDGAGDLLIADNGNNRVVEVPAGGGTQITLGSALSNPTGVAVDGLFDVFIADSGNGRVVEVPAGSGAQVNLATGLNNPEGIAIDATGNLFVVVNAGGGSGTGSVVKIPAGGGSPITLATGFTGPQMLALDSGGNLLVADGGTGRVVELPAGGAPQFTLASGFGFPWGVALDGAGDVFVADAGHSQVVELERSQPPSLNFALTSTGSTSTDSPQAVSVQNIGNQTLMGTLTPVSTTNFLENPGCATFTLAPGAICSTSFSFGPQTTGYLTDTAYFSDNNLNLASSVVAQAVNLSGVGDIAGQAATVTVPNLVGMTQTAATNALTGAGLALGSVSSEYSSGEPAGSVIGESPAAGTEVSPGSQVKLLISIGEAPAPSPNPLTFENNYFVTGDYASGGVTLRGTGVNGMATGVITIPDSTTSPGSQGVPDGADIIDAYLYWETLENTPTPSANTGTFLGYSITGQQVGSDLTNYTDGAFTGTLRAYRADVNTYIPVGASGVRFASGNFSVSMPDGRTALPLTEGASLVVIYRVLVAPNSTTPPSMPLKSVVIYDGSAIPGTSTTSATQDMQGFYDAVGGSAETTTLSYNSGNAAWNNTSGSATLTAHASQYNATLNQGTAYVAEILSTPVTNTDNDGILNAWKSGPSSTSDFFYGQPGYYDVKTQSWVPLPGAKSGEQDLFVQLDYMCGAVTNGVCSGENLYPSPDANGNDPLAMVQQAFLATNIHLHLQIGNAVPEDTCTDNLTTTPPQLCQFPSQPGVIGWKNSLEFSKIWPRNFTACASGGDCTARFPYGQKDSYHYVLFGHSLAIPAWNTRYGTLTGIQVVAGGTTTISTTGIPSCPSRITISGVLGNPGINGEYNTTGCTATSMTVATPSGVSSWTFPNSTLPEPVIGVTSGTVTSISGYSDLGGADSAVTLALWETSPTQNMATRANVIAGTLYHEIGHTLGLSHGGLYYQTPGSYMPTFDVNCKPNYQSVMNYLFQIDGLGPSQAVAYSNQTLITLNDSSLNPATPVTDSGGNAATFPTSAWYLPINANTTTASAATMYCDGAALSTNSQGYYRVNGSIAPTINPAWASGENITYDSVPYTTLAGYNDTANIDLRQVGATGGEFAALANILSFGTLATPLAVAPGGNVSLSSGGTVTLGTNGSVSVGNNSNVTLGSAGTISSAGGVIVNNGSNVTLSTGGSVTLGKNGTITLATGSGGLITLGSGGLVTLGSGGLITLGSGGLVTLGSGGTITPVGGIAITIPSTGGTYTLPDSGGSIVLTNGGTVGLSSNTSFTLGSGGLITMGSGGLVTLGSGGLVTLGSGGLVTMGSGGLVTLGSGGNVTLSSGGLITMGSGGLVTLGSGGLVTLGSGGLVTLGSGGVSVGSGGTAMLGSGGTVTLSSGGSLTLANGGTLTLASGGLVTLGSGGGQINGTTEPAGTYNVNSGGLITLGSGGLITLGSGGLVTMGSGGLVTLGSGGLVTLGSGGLVTLGSGGVSLGSGGLVTLGSGGVTTAEMNYDNANSIVRPPPSATYTQTGGSITVNWQAPAFGVVQTYTIYRSVNLGNPVAIGSVSGGGANGFAPATTFTDTAPPAGTLVYTISTTLVPDTNGSERQSPPSPPAVLTINQNIALGSIPSSVALPGPLTISATAETNNAPNGLPVNFSATGPCSIGSQSPPNANSNGASMASVTLSSTGSCIITASQAGTSGYNAASPVSGTFTIMPANSNIQAQTITFAPLPNVQYGSSFPVSASTLPSGQSVSFTAAGPCTVGATLGTATVATNGVGVCKITASAAAYTANNTSYSAASLTQGFTILPATLTVTANNATAMFGHAFPAFTYTYIGYVNGDGTANPPVVSGAPALSTTATVGSPIGSYPIVVSTGTLAAANYSFFYVNGTLTIGQASQNITFSTSPPASAAYNSSFTVAATASSGLPVSYGSSGACGNVGATYTMTGSTGTCSVIVSQAGNSNYSAAPTVTQTVAASGPAITLSPSSVNFGSVTVNSISIQSITVTNTGNAAATISTPIVSLLKAGNSDEYVAVNLCPSSLAAGKSCTITIGFYAGAYYNTPQTATLEVIDNAPGSPQPVALTAIVLEPQTITFTANPPASAVYQSSFTVAATASSGLGVTYTSSGSCTNSGATYTMTSGTGTCSVIANQAGNSTYAGAPQVTKSVTATLAAQTITFTTNPPASAGYNTTFTVAASASSGLGVTYTSSGSCSNSAGTYNMTKSTGTCSVIVNQAGNSNYSAAPQVTKSVTATVAAQTITFTTNPPSSAAYKTSFTVAATASSGLGVTYTSSGACTNSGATYTMSSATGSCSVIANQAGNSNYSAAPQVTKPVTATLATQAITFSTNPPTSAAYKTSFTVAATASSGLSVTYTSSGACSNSGATYTMTSGTGTCSVIANQAGNSNYSAAPQVTMTVTATYSTASLAPTSMNFGTVASGKSSTAQTATLTNTGTTPLIISSIGFTGTNPSNFTETNTCPSSSSSLAAGAKCTISVTFKSSGSAASASLTVTDNTQAGTQSVSLSGN